MAVRPGPPGPLAHADARRLPVPFGGLGDPQRRVADGPLHVVDGGFEARVAVGQAITVRRDGLEGEPLLRNHHRDLADLERTVVAVPDPDAKHTRTTRRLQAQAFPRLALFSIPIEARLLEHGRPREGKRALAERGLAPLLDARPPKEFRVAHVDEHRPERLVARAEIEDEARLPLRRIVRARQPRLERELARLAPLLGAHPRVEDLEARRIVGPLEDGDLQELLVA